MRTSADGGCLIVAVCLVLVALQLSLVGCLIWVAFHFILKYW
jgi:hypothetical protein